MEWRIKLEAKTVLGEVTKVEIATVSRRVVSATDEDVGPSLAESKAILSTLQQAIVTAQLDEYHMRPGLQILSDMSVHS